MDVVSNEAPFQIDEMPISPPTDPTHPALRLFRIFATEFQAIKTDSEVCIWLDMTAPLVSERFFLAMYLQALALLTAHRMKMAAMAQDVADDIYPIKSLSGESASASYAINLPNLDTSEGSLKLTKYGQAFLEIRNAQPVGPIV